MTRTTHIAYSDESQHNIGRYHAIGMVTLPATLARELSEELQNEIKSSGVNEIKWKKVKSARDRFAALKVIDKCNYHALRNNIRIDTLVWDTQDTRHAVSGRDDNKNFQNMYIQLIKNVFRKRWPNDSTWQVFPDETSLIDWEYVRAVLSNSDRFMTRNENLFGYDWRTLHAHYGILEIAEINSGDVYLAQIADLFAGMGVFSYENYDVYKTWETQNSPQLQLFASEEKVFSSKEDEHSRVLNEFLQLSRKYRLGVSLDPNQGLVTHNPQNPINYWLYIPQKDYDRAPLRNSRGNKR